MTTSAKNAVAARKIGRKECVLGIICMVLFMSGILSAGCDYPLWLTVFFYTTAIGAFVHATLVYRRRMSLEPVHNRHSY